MKSNSLLFLFLSTLFLSFCKGMDDGILFLKNKNDVDSIRIEISENKKADREISIYNKTRLKRISFYLKSLQRTSKPYGGSIDKLFVLIIYKAKRSIKLYIDHSIYHGWTLFIGGYNTAFDSPYLFDYVDSLVNIKDGGK